jgi:hypothetical protein
LQVLLTDDVREQVPIGALPECDSVKERRRFKCPCSASLLAIVQRWKTTEVALERGFRVFEQR